MGFYRAMAGVLGVAAFGLCAGAQAAERLSFQPPPEPHLSAEIRNFLHWPAIEIARADLNGDGIAEFIVRNPEDCKAESLCLFGILADTEGKIVDLGRIKARALALSDDYTQGIRNIMAFDNPANDFAYTVYAWEPQSIRYKMKE